MKAHIAVLFLLIAAVAQAPGQAQPANAPPQTVPPVIAYVEGGINPYHLAFREPTWTAHPSTYIPGYPEEAVSFPITLDAANFEEAWERDEALWASVQPMQLYYIPGTRIVGAILTVDSQNTSSYDHFYDHSHASHSTKIADAGSGRDNGVAPESAIVVVTGSGVDFGVRWVASQPWIDIQSTSVACLAGVVGIPPGIQSDQEIQGWAPDFPGAADSSFRMTKAGRLVFNGAGNGPGANLTCDMMGPPWVMTIGAISGNNTTQYPYMVQTSWLPWEVAAKEMGFLAIKDTLDAVEWSAGTSMSGPRMAGYAARLITEARRALGDPLGFGEGALARQGPGAELPAAGPLADGRLERQEVEDLLRKNAHDFPLPEEKWWGITIPPETYYTLKGYGGFMEPSYQQAVRVLLGQQPMPDRPMEDKWHARYDAIAGAYWEPLACRAISPQDQWDECWTEGVPRHVDDMLSTL